MTDIGDLLAGRPLIVILRGTSTDDAVRIAEEVWDTGAGIVEVPIQSAASVEALRRVCERAGERAEPVGAGTVLTREHVEIAARAGAVFTVAPGLSKQVVRASRAAGLTHLPGVGSATEVDRALQLGCAWLKAFPAAALGAEWITAMHGPFPEARLVATGGITATNAPAFLRAGAAALGVGGAALAAPGLTALVDATRSVA